MKLSLKTLDKVLSRCTGKEIDLVIYLAQYQDEEGIVGGIYYRNAMEDIDISESAFYKCLYSLEQKGIISISNEYEHRYWTLKIADNAFCNDKDYKKGYINLNYEILHSKDFRRMSRSEKVIVLKVLQLMYLHAAKKFITLRLETLMDWTGKSLRSVRRIAERLSKAIKLTVNGSKVLIDHHHRLPNRRMVKEATVRNAHIVAYVLHKTQTHAEEKDFFDATIALKQYGVKSFAVAKEIVLRAIRACGYLAPRWIGSALKERAES